jgi:uncharacterized protein (TIGR02453 family)
MAEKMIKGFNGFTQETLYFFETLKENNNKPWFDQNREVYDEYVLGPAKSFVVAMGERLKELSPVINADPRTNKSLFRINRDTRFSKDKSPYKTHMGIIFWDGDLPRMESSVFYFHLEPGSIMLGTGIYKFTRPQLEEYRNSVVHPRYGKELKSIYKDLTGKGFEFGGKNYKKIPRGFDGGHENADLLLYDGMHVGKDYEIPKEFYSRELIDFCFEPFKEMYLIQKWLSELVKRT